MAEDILKRERAAAEDGQALAEYALIIALVAIVCFAAVQALGASVSTVIQSVAGAL